MSKLNRVSNLLILSGLALAPLSMSYATQSDEDWGDDSGWGDSSWEEQEAGSEWTGFFEAAGGGRLQDDPALAEDKTLSDIRLRLERSGYHGENRYAAKADIYYDGVEHQLTGDLRELSYRFSFQDNWDFKVGQQILTWGTGDLVFLNDLFPKDWQSFFSGRDTEYLKAPVAAVKASYFGQQASLDLVWMPVFTSDRFIDGERFSYFSPMANGNVSAPAFKVDPTEPERDIENGELAARVSGLSDSTEWALYGYRGFQKQPNGLDSMNRPIFTRLDVLGASVRGNLGAGLANAEIAWHMAEDSAGDDPLKPNDQLRFLLGYEQELLPKLTLGLQYYLEKTLDYDALTASSPSPYNPDQYRHLYTTRLSYRMWQDNLTLSLFAFYSPSDQDHFIRPTVNYRFDDNLSMAVGANLYSGEQQHTFFGQFEDASNLYARVRYAF